MKKTFKVGDKIKVVKLNTFVCKGYESFIGQVFTVTGAHSRGVSTTSPSTAFSGLFFYNEEVELVEDDIVVNALLYEVGNYIKVKKITHPSSTVFHDAAVGKNFKVEGVDAYGVSTPEGYYFYFDEIELTTPDTVSLHETTVPNKKNHAWAVVNKGTGKVEWIRQTRSVARKLAQFQNETSTHLYQVKKIEYNFV